MSAASSCCFWCLVRLQSHHFSGPHHDEVSPGLLCHLPRSLRRPLEGDPRAFQVGIGMSRQRTIWGRGFIHLFERGQGLVAPVRQDGFISRVVIHNPSVHQSLVHITQQTPPGFEPAADGDLRDVMASLPHALGHALHRLSAEGKLRENNSTR